jgi:hypothetical protein
MANPAMMRIPLAAIILAVLLFSCGGQERITPTVSFLNGNALLPSVSFTTRNPGKYRIQYWPQDEAERVQESKLSSGTDHHFVLINVRAATNYQYVVVNMRTGRKSDPINFQTRKLPAEITQTSKQLIDSALFEGYVLVRGLAPKGSDVMINSEGDVVWYHQYDTTVRRPFVWTNHQSVLSVYDSSQLVDVDLYGEKLLDIRLEDHGIPNMLHHEALYDAKGNIVALTHDSLKMDLTKVGHKGEHYIRADGIVVLSPSATKIWEWNLLSVYDPRNHPSQKVDLDQSLGHANSIAIDADGHYVVSFRDFSQLWKINSNDGTVMWKLGKDGDFRMSEDGYFLRQHSNFFDEQGELMLFDNGDRKIRTYSRILSFRLDEEAMTAEITVNVVLPPELSADKMCSAQRIAPGQYLVCTSKRNGIISVVNDKAEVLWRVDLNKPSYRAYYLKDPFKITDDVGHDTAD